MGAWGFFQWLCVSCDYRFSDQTMYNGIGLPTPRGSGTNGFVQRNLSALRVTNKQLEPEELPMKPATVHREPNQDILNHEKKRQVEVKCVKLQIQLTDEG